MTPEQIAEKLRCAVTGNVCGTDTHGERGCRCLPCRVFAAEQRAEAAEAGAAAVLMALEELWTSREIGATHVHIRDVADVMVKARESVGKALLDRLRRLEEAARYAAGSFAQVPSDKTVPPIVLHDCREKLEAALEEK